MSLSSIFLIAALLPSASVREIPSDVRSEPVTTCAAANTRLSARPDERIFFRLQGDVVADLGSRLVLEDASEPALVIVSCDVPYRCGDRLSLVCTAYQPTPGPFLIAEALDFTVISHQPPPPVAAVSPADLISGRHAFREVRLSGIVTDAFHDEVGVDWCIVTVEAEGAKAMVWVPGQTITEDRLAALVDASVSVSGVVFPSINSSRRYLRQWMQTASADAIRILEPAPADPFARNAGGDHRRTCSGTVLAAWNERSLFIRTADGERLEVRLAPGQSTPPAGAQLAVRFNVPRTRLSDNTVHALLRIIRELSINAVRHGRASTIRIAGSLDGDTLAFSVRDDGCGFDPTSAPGVLQGHFGLEGIRERVRALGGTLTIESAPGCGAKAIVRLYAGNDTSGGTLP